MIALGKKLSIENRMRNLQKRKATESKTIPNSERLIEGTALCLSGGGFRAMLFHLGVLIRLNEIGILSKLAQISSVSGGSIVAAYLGWKWEKLRFGSKGIASNLREEIVIPLIKFSEERCLDLKSMAKGFLIPGLVNRSLRDSYDRLLFGGVRLSSLPEKPKFVFHASNLNTGSLWKFTKGEFSDWKGISIHGLDLKLSEIVAASSSFPPFLSPYVLSLRKASKNKTTEGMDKIVLVDGGVYDNFGVESALKKYKTIYISDGGAPYETKARQGKNWFSQLLRVIDTLELQIRNLRLRQMHELFSSGRRKGGFLSIAGSSRILDKVLDYDGWDGSNVASLPTRLDRIRKSDRNQLINWGYKVAFFTIGKAKRSEFKYPL
ncbi:patatin-like phospholipase family protein [Leptospira wolffii]|nr:patatin-like phospholipase family protein [Leptospira wolffii]